MTKREILVTRFGEMADMIACFAIYNGAEPKEHKKKLSYDEAINVR